MVDGTIVKRRTRHVRKLSKAIGQIVLNVKTFFQKEKRRGRFINLKKVTQRVMLATGVGRNTVCKLSTQKYVDQLQVKPKDKRTRNMTVDDAFVSLIRKALRWPEKIPNTE